jgi:transcriptional regulator with XRE-family HTH domain
MPADARDPVMKRVQFLFEESGKTLEQLGLDMGYPQGTARQSAWQFMKTNDPRLSMLRKFAKAVGVTMAELFAEKKATASKHSGHRAERK